MLHICLQVLLEASRLAGRSPQDIVQLLRTDTSAKITSSGAVVYGCGLHPGHEHDHHPSVEQQTEQWQRTRPKVPGSKDTTDAPGISKVFQLHSNATSPLKVFLEFQGCVTEVSSGAPVSWPTMAMRACTPCLKHLAYSCASCAFTKRWQHTAVASHNTFCDIVNLCLSRFDLAGGINGEFEAVPLCLFVCAWVCMHPNKLHVRL